MNGQRHDLNAIEEAEGYYQLFEAGRSVTAMATTLGRSAKHISAPRAARAPEEGSTRDRAKQDQPE